MKIQNNNEINTSSSSIEVFNSMNAKCNSIEQAVRTIEAIECVRKCPELFEKVKEEEV